MLHRRDAMLGLGRLGLGALSLPTLLRAEASGPLPMHRAKSCIFLFLWGGPPQQDLWDPKPDAPEEIRGPFKPIDTAVPGIRIGDQMPLLATRMNQVALVRSLSHDSNVHESSVYRVLSGERDPTMTLPRNQRNRRNAPFFGSVLASQSPSGDMPAAVTIPRPVGHDGVTYAGTHGGWLGPRFDPLEPKETPAAGERAPDALTLPEELDSARLQARRGLLKLIEDGQRLADHRGSPAGGFYEQAFRMVASQTAKRAFDLNLEPASIRERYGRNEYGESFLLARRLVEAGVRLVSVNWMYIFPTGRVSNVWDNHAGYNIHGAKTGFDLLRSPVCIPPLDRALSALLDDLSVRGLLEETLIVAVGEFGRTPKINPTGGREHWGACQSILLAGGGIRGGQVFGASDSIGAYVRDRPVSPEDLLATIYHAFGLSPNLELRDREGRPHRAGDGTPITGLFQ